jgi:hypothetical protein
MRALSSLGIAAPIFLSLSRMFDLIGTDTSGFFLEMNGYDHGGRHKRILFELTAKSGCGPMIPCVPAIVATMQLARGDIVIHGATACVGLLDLDALFKELRCFDIEEHVTRSM